jgi:hypothetical protein
MTRRSSDWLSAAMVLLVDRTDHPRRMKGSKPVVETTVITNIVEGYYSVLNGHEGTLSGWPAASCAGAQRTRGSIHHRLFKRPSAINVSNLAFDVAPCFSTVPIALTRSTRASEACFMISLESFLRSSMSPFRFRYTTPIKAIRTPRRLAIIFLE